MQTPLSNKTLEHYANDGAAGIASALARHQDIADMARELLERRNQTEELTQTPLSHEQLKGVPNGPQ